MHLHVHSHYSFMRGVNSPEQLCAAAARFGMTHLALTDVNGVYGLGPFLEAARKHGLRPIIGAELVVGTDRAVVLAKTPQGYERLCGLLSALHLDGDFSLRRDFPEAQEHLALLGSDPDLLRALRAKADCWVELLPGPAGRRALTLARELKLPVVAGNDVHFVHPEDHPLHRLLRAIDCNRTLSTLAEAETVAPERWLQPPERMAAHFPHCPEAISNTVVLAARCHTDWDLSRTVFPDYQDHRRDHFSLLLDRCRAGIRRRYRHGNAAVERRLAEELTLIRTKGYVDYFLVVADLVRRRPLHCGRGSAAASLVSYLLGITHVDPIAHRLVFGRFLNPQRRDHPDIDVDFPWDERDALLAEVERDYGPERFAMVANHVGFGGRGAVREVAKVYGMPPARIREVTRRLSGWTDPERIWERVRTHPKFAGFALDPPWPEILELAARLDGVPRYLSVHCGGVILAPDRVARYVPVQRSAKGVRIIQWEKDQTQAAGLVKIDLLGNRSLAVIRDALAAVAANTGVRLDYAALNPVDDPATLDLLRRGATMGVFYVESPAMRQLQQKTGRGDFEHLVIHSSIIRPAANRYIREYLRRLHGGAYQPIHPSLEDLLKETYGILVYQEQVVLTAMILAGFDWGEADGLRKVLSKKSPRRLADYRERFAAGCTRRGVSAEVIETVWDMFTSFAGYSFCKPHSASYALVSFKSAYLKAHYPAEFMAAVIANGGGYYTTYAYLAEARRLGLKVLGPDINRGGWAYRGRGAQIRMGLMQLHGVDEGAIHRLIEERERRGPFRSLADLLDRVRLRPADGAVLVKSGALDCLAAGLNRPQLLWLLSARLQSAQRARHDRNRSWVPEAGSDSRSVPPLEDCRDEQIRDQELEALGFVLSAHPLTPYRKALGPTGRGMVLARDLARWLGRRVRVLGWPLCRKEVLTRDGEAMEFVTFEDESGLYETVFFPEAFKRFCSRLDRDRAYWLEGKVEQEYGALNLVVDRLHALPLPGSDDHAPAGGARRTKDWGGMPRAVTGMEGKSRSGISPQTALTIHSGWARPSP